MAGGLAVLPALGPLSGTWGNLLACPSVRTTVQAIKDAYFLGLVNEKSFQFISSQGRLWKLDSVVAYLSSKSCCSLVL